VCPICGAVNTFQSVTGTPADVYGGAGKLQYVFWPAMDKRVIYSCKRCRYTVYMGDWNAIPHEKSELIHAALKKLTTDTNVSDYTTIPMSARFDMAEKIYIAWGKDAAFMCAFYRACAWHLDGEQKAAEAAAARMKALDIAAKMLSTELKAGARKELLFISGSLKHFMGHAGALEDLKAAKAIAYEDEKDLLAPGIRRDQYLTKLIDELIVIAKKAYNEEGAKEEKKSEAAAAKDEKTADSPAAK